MKNMRTLFAEFLGTFWLVLGGCGAVVISNGDPHAFGLVGIALAFGLCITAMAYAVGPISGGHFNPAVSIGLFMAGRFEGGKLIGYVLAQVIGAIAGAGVLFVIASGAGAFDPATGMASNGYEALSPRHYSMTAALLCEVVTTFIFVTVILGVTDGRRHLPGW
jgi:aquaporin Z